MARCSPEGSAQRPRYSLICSALSRILLRSTSAAAAAAATTVRATPRGAPPPSLCLRATIAKKSSSLDPPPRPQGQIIRDHLGVGRFASAAQTVRRYRSAVEKRGRVADGETVVISHRERKTMASRMRCCVVSKARQPPARAVTDDDTAGTPLNAAALGALKLKALKAKALEAGVSADAIADADDAEDVSAIKAAVIQLIVDSGRCVEGEDFGELRAELSAMKLSALRKRAVADGVDDAAMEDAADGVGGEEKEVLIALIVSRQKAPGAEGVRVTELRAELGSMKLSALRKRAYGVGVDEGAMEAAADGDDEKSEIIALLVAHSSGVDAGSSAVAGGVSGDRPGASYTVEAELAETALRVELEGLKLKELRQRAKAAGMSASALDSAMDADEPAESLRSFLIEQHTADAGRRAGETSLRQELQGLGLKALRRRAKDAGATAEELIDAMDADEPKDAVVELLLAMRESSESQALGATRAEQRLLTELHGLRLKDLRKRAKELGVGSDALENAMDSDDPDAAVVELIVARSRSVGEDKPHFGSAPAPAAASMQPPASVLQPSQPLASGASSTKHVMLSYQWDHQAQVTRVYDMLTRLGVSCWMDIRSGMGADIYEGMANAVSNASAVVCFMSEKYQQSANCMLEVKFAKQSGVGMIPVMMEGSGWRPSGWLGLITAGSLWVRLSDESQFEDNIRQLYGQIQGMAGATVEIEEANDEGVATAAEAKEELARLRDDLEAKAESQTIAAVLADPSQPATIPAGVPKLPPRFETTDQIRELTRLVLSTSASDMRSED